MFGAMHFIYYINKSVIHRSLLCLIKLRRHQSRDDSISPLE